MSGQRALLLDRDGVINVDHGYVHRPEDIEFVSGIFALCRRAVALDYRLVVVTNQAGIGRGYYTEADFHTLTDWMRGIFAEEGCPLDAVYFCPTHPVHGLGEYRRESSRRKPHPGMILDAARDLSLDLAVSILVGDKPSDIAAGLAAGVGRNVLLAGVDASMKPVGAVIVRSLAEVEPLLEP